MISIIQDDPPPTPTPKPLIPSTEIFINLDALQRLKTHMYPKIMQGLGNIKPKDVKIPNQDFILCKSRDLILQGIHVEIQAAIQDQHLYLEPDTQSIRVEIENLKVKGTGKLVGVISCFGGDLPHLTTNLILTGSGPHFRVVAFSTTQEHDGGTLPKLEITTNEGKIDDIQAKIDDDKNIGVQILNALAKAIQPLLKDQLIKAIEPLLGNKDLIKEMEKEINVNIIQKGIKIENQVKDSKINLTLRTASTGPLVIEKNGISMPADVRFYPPGKGDQPLYSECVDPNKYLDRSKAFYDVTASVDRCFLYSFLRSLIDVEFHDIVKVPANDFGVGSVQMALLPFSTESADFMEITPGQVKTKVRGQVTVDFSPPFTFICDANIGLSLEKNRPHFSFASYFDARGNFFSWSWWKSWAVHGKMLGGLPPPMAEYNIIVSVDNIFNIDSSKSRWIPQSAIEFVVGFLKDTLFKRNPVPFKLPGICVDHGKDDEFCVANPEIYFRQDYIGMIADLSV